MLIDDGLNWDPHIKQLSLQLSKSSAIIYRLRNFVDTETLKLLYYSLIYSRVQYGIILWGTARDVAAAPQTPQLGGARPTLGAQVSLKLLFGYVTIFSSADLFTTD